MIDPNGRARIAAKYFPGTGWLALALILVFGLFTGVGAPAAPEFLLDRTHANPDEAAREQHQKPSGEPIAHDDALWAKWRELERTPPSGATLHQEVGCDHPPGRGAASNRLRASGQLLWQEHSLPARKRIESL